MQPTITQHLQDYDDYLTLKNFSPSTREMYLRTLKRFLRFCNRKYPAQVISQDLAKQFIIYRKHQKKSWSTLNCDYSSLRKYFREVMHKEWTLRKIPRPRRTRILPQILSLQDVTKLINHASTYKHQVFICFVYVTGLRLSEATGVLLSDIDRDRLQIRVSQGKGGKDRYIRIPKVLIEILECYYRYYRPEKYLFNGWNIGDRYCASSGQWTMRQAKKKSKLSKQASIHTLRHAYATHHLEGGTDLVFLKNQLGHKYLKTTEKYIHLCAQRHTQINHPIDILEIKYRDKTTLGRSRVYTAKNISKPTIHP